jgi:hypothetical protein
MRRRSLWLLLLAAIAVAVAAVAIPVWVIRPFSPQSERGVAISYLLRRISPALTIALEIAVIALLVSLWRGARWWSRAFLVVAMLAVGMTTWLARQNHFEWMFHPLPDARYAPASAATFVEPSDLVIAVERNGEAAAYPVRQLGYHHVVMDVVGRVPIVVTY